MEDPVLRVLMTLELLQGRNCVTGAELAEALQVGVRTVQRYIVRLRELNIPVEASPGVGGSYRLRPGARLPPLLLTNEEAFALSLGLRSLQQIGLEAFAPATEGALSKLGRILPVALRSSLETVKDFIAFEQKSWMIPAPAESLLTAASAIRTGSGMRFAYRSHNGKASQRQVEPYAVLHTDDRWYLIGRCRDRQAIRTFRLDRMEELQPFPATYHRPEDFDARRYLEEHLPFVQSKHQMDVWIDLPFAEAKHSFALWRVAMEEENGGTRLRCGRDNLDFFAAMLLSTGHRVVVHRPAALRATFRMLAQRATQASEPPAGVSGPTHRARRPGAVKQPSPRRSRQASP